jgi:ABC-type transport system involved in multi-copper enzyme maturation permease subunit
MTWVTWRQYRLQWAIALGLLAAFGAMMVVTGLQMASQWHSALAACTAARTCGSLSGSLFLGSHTVGFLVILTLGVPAVLGILLGAPLVASEIESGTSLFAWTQGITRGRWLAIKAGWALLAAAGVTGAVSALVTWWSGPDNALQGDGFNPGRFDIMGIAPVGYAVFAVALGIAAGTLMRRVIPAIAVTLAGFIAVRAVIYIGLRQHFMTAVTHVYGLTQSFTPPGSAWQVAAGALDPGGRMIPLTDGTDIAQNVSSSAVPVACHGLNNAATLSCMQSAGYRQFVSYQPGSRYWAFQGIETGIFLALAAVLLAVTFCVIRRRDA